MIEQLIDDVVILKKRNLLTQERQNVIDEIYRIQNKLKPIGVVIFNEEELYGVSDYDMLMVLYYQYLLFSIKYFKEISYEPNNCKIWEDKH